MNVARAIELGIAAVMRQFGGIGAGVVIRPWQSLGADGSWKPEKDREFPLMDIRCGPPQTDDQRTLFQDCAILCGTKTDDDKNHAQISELYAAAQGVVDKLLGQFWSGVDGEELTAFKAALAYELGEAFNGVGGLTMGDGQAPFDNGGVNMIGLTVRVHYSRTDY